MKKRRILVLEDDEDIALFLSQILSGAKELSVCHSIDSLESGSQQYDIALVDLNLPDSRGLDTLAYVRSKWPEAVTIVVTGLGEEEASEEDIKRMGAFGVIRKPSMTADSVVTTIRDAIADFRVEGYVSPAQKTVKEMREIINRPPPPGEAPPGCSN